MSKRATIQDIARQTGFSAATVSLVLNNRAGIPDVTRERVIKVAESLEYDLARLKRKRRTARQSISAVGLFLRLSEEQLSQSNPFYSIVVSGIEEACRLQNIQLLYTHVNVDLRNRPCEVPNINNGRDLDGLMLVGVFLEDNLIQAFKGINIPVVLVDAYSEQDIYDSVVTKNFQGAYQAVSFLIQKGHRRIAMLGAYPGIYPSFDERRYGCLSALRDNQIDQLNYCDTAVRVGGEDFYNAAYRLLTTHPETTAIFCANDSMAIEAIRAAHDLHMRVPEDLSVVGFDDIDTARYITPALTTIQVDKANMGRMAVRVLQQRTQFPGLPPITHALPVKLIERQSVASCPIR